MRVQGHVINPLWIVELPICNPHSADPRSANQRQSHNYRQNVITRALVEVWWSDDHSSNPLSQKILLKRTKMNQKGVLKYSIFHNSTGGLSTVVGSIRLNSLHQWGCIFLFLSCQVIHKVQLGHDCGKLKYSEKKHWKEWLLEAIKLSDFIN